MIGVSPTYLSKVERDEFAPPPPFNPITDAQANALQRQAYGTDDKRRCVIN